MSDSFHEEEYKGCTIRLAYDLDPMDPREWDNIGVMLFWHGRYGYGDDAKTIERAGLTKADPDYYGGWEELLKACGVKESDVVIPVFGYDHGGMTIRAGSYGNWPDIQWDAGQLGYIVCPVERIRYEFDVKRVSAKLRKRVAEILVAEVNTYDQFITGDVFWWETLDEDGERIDSCGGYYGAYDDQEREYVMSEARASIDWHLGQEAA